MDFLWGHLKEHVYAVTGLLKILLQYEVVSESSRIIIIVTASVKVDERGGQVHTSASLLHQSAM
jgi:hypothetical protein